MSKKPATRKYQNNWNSLKSAGKIIITLNNHAIISPARKHKYLCTIRKAIQKEKYYDWEFKKQFPDAEIIATIIVDEGSICFELNLNRRNLAKLF